MSKKLFIQTLGCAMNVRDSEHIIAELSQKEDYSLTQNIEEADLILINTCSVVKSQFISSLARLEPLKKPKKEALK